MCKEIVKLTVKSEDANKGKVIVIDSSSNTVLIPSKSGGFLVMLKKIKK